MQVKHIDELMKYLRKEKGIIIKGANQKRDLRNMGYYHGYKGYRFYRKPSLQIPYKSFNELTAVYRFDMEIKALLYPEIMFLETAIKNHVLEQALHICNSERFEDFFEIALTKYKELPNGSKEQKLALSRRSKLKSRIYRNLANDYSNKPIVKHFKQKGKPLPLWATFEIIGLSDLGNLLSCMNTKAKLSVSQAIGLDIDTDKNGEVAESAVYAIKDLRNAVAHNDVVFDLRFQEYEIDSDLQNYFSKKLGIGEIKFTSLDEYIILIAYFENCFGKSRVEIMRFISSFQRRLAALKARLGEESEKIVVDGIDLIRLEKYKVSLLERKSKKNT